MGQYKISKAGNISGGGSGIPDFTRALTQSIAKLYVQGSDAIVDNSGGVPDVNNTVRMATYAVDTPANGNSQATKATLDTQMGNVQNALATLFAHALSIAALLGVEAPTYAGGGTNGNGTIGAISTAVAGAATGPTASAGLNPSIDSINGAMYTLACVIKKIAVATGDNELQIDQSGAYAGAGQSAYQYEPAVAALDVTSDAAVAIGLTAMAANATLTLWQNNIATMAAVLNAVNTPRQLLVRAVS